MTPRCTLLTIVSIIATSILLSACSPTDEIASEKDTVTVRPVKTIVVKSNSTTFQRTYSAIVLPAQEVELSFRVSGRIVELPIRGGANVKKGDVIAQLDRRDFEAEVTRVQSQIEQAEAQLTALTSGARAEDIATLEAAVDAVQVRANAAKDQLGRSEKLLKRGVVTKAKVETDTTNLRVAEAELEAKKQELIKGKSGARVEDVAAQEAAIKGLKSTLKSLNDSLSDATLRAPFDGVIAVRKVENFSNIQAKEAVATLQTISTPNLMFDIPASDIPTLAGAKDIDLKVVLDSISDREFIAESSEFSTQADAATQTFRGRVSIKNPDADPILPGMVGSLIVTVEQADKSVLNVPISAVSSNADGSAFVWVVAKGDNKLAKRTISTGEASGSVIEVTKGLKEGDVVVTAGLSALQENMVVKPITAVGE